MCSYWDPQIHQTVVPEIRSLVIGDGDEEYLLVAHGVPLAGHDDDPPHHAVEAGPGQQPLVTQLNKVFLEPSWGRVPELDSDVPEVVGGGGGES